MGGYSRANLLGKQGIWQQNEKTGFWKIVREFVSSFSSTVSLTIAIPTPVYLRTKLLCEYINDEVGVDFDVSNFLMVLYLDFIHASVKRYEPLYMYRSIHLKYPKADTLIISQGSKILAEYKRDKETRTDIWISMDKKDVLKGEMVLYELDELYGHQLTFEEMLANLWINFIEEYKRGNHEKALNAIIKMLKKQKKEEAD